VAITSQGGVGGELARGAALQPDAGFEVADRELDRGVAAVILVQLDGGADSVGDQGGALRPELAPTAASH
jgi:hypothetical protein